MFHIVFTGDDHDSGPFRILSSKDLAISLLEHSFTLAETCKIGSLVYAP